MPNVNSSSSDAGGGRASGAPDAGTRGPGRTAPASCRESRSFPRRAARSRCRTALAGAFLVAAGGCESLTRVSAPDLVDPSSLENAAGARTLRAGAIAQFTDGFSGGASYGRGQVIMSGTIADEFTATHLNEAADRRALSNLRTDYPELPLQAARVSLVRATRAMQRYVPDARADIGQLFALTGFVAVFFAENLCSGTPLSELRGDTLVYGPSLTTAQLLDRAVEMFDSALVYAGASARIEGLARVGRARALLFANRLAEARDAVATVPTGFVYQTEHSAVTQQNGVYVATEETRAWSVADREGRNGLDFRSADDPRVRTRLLGTGGDGVTPSFGLTSVDRFSAPLTLASGTEARLIEAEAALRRGDAAEALGLLNALRVPVPGLAPLAPQATEAARVDQLMRERAFWLFASGHRHGDLRRLVRQYHRERESVFPTGPYRSGLFYDGEVTFPQHRLETGNPLFTGCFDREA